VKCTESCPESNNGIVRTPVALLSVIDTDVRLPVNCSRSWKGKKMLIRELSHIEDVVACKSAQHRTFTRKSRRIKMANAVATAALARAKQLRGGAAKPTPKAKAADSKPKSKRASKGTYDRNAQFACTVKGCGKTITGPWSYKQHLIKVHEYTPEQAGLNPRGPNTKKKAVKK
jgi:hypothetical protein